MQETYEQLRERFSWKNHVSEGGIKALSHIEHQKPGMPIFAD
jgi:hypothetical protein